MTPEVEREVREIYAAYGENNGKLNELLEKMSKVKTLMTQLETDRESLAAELKVIREKELAMLQGIEDSGKMEEFQKDLEKLLKTI